MPYEDNDIKSYVFPEDSVIRIKFKNNGKVFKIGRVINDGDTLLFEKDKDIHHLRALNAYGIPKVILDNTNAINIVIHEKDGDIINRHFVSVDTFKKFGITKKFESFETQVFLCLDRFDEIIM